MSGGSKTWVLRLQILAASVFVLVVAQVFSAGLGILSFQKNYLDSVLESYQTVGNDLQQKVQRALRYGKRIETFLGMEELLRPIPEKYSLIDRAEVFGPDGVVRYSSRPAAAGQPVLPELTPRAGAAGEGFVKAAGSYFLLFPIRDRAGTQVATASLSFPARAIQERVGAEAARSVRTAAFVVAGAAVLLALGLTLFVPLTAASEVPRNRLFAVVFVSILAGQVAFAAATMKELRDGYVLLAHEKVRTVATRLHEDLQSLLAKGIAIDQLYRVEKILRELVDATPEVAGIQITDGAGRTLYEERRQAALVGAAQVSDGAGFQVTLALARDPSDFAIPDGHLRIDLAADQVNRKVRAFALDAVTVLLISLLFVTEVVLFLLLFVTRWAGRGRASGPGGSPQAPTYGFVRTATAMFLFGVMQCASFVPLHMRQLAETAPLPGISTTVLMGLPISVEMFCSLLTVFLAGLWMDRRGWHEPFAVGIVLASYAAFLCGTTTSPVAFILYRGLAGLGYGLTWMSAQGFVVASTDASSKARAISSLVAGIFVGHICGGAVGAMLADRIGFSAVFQVAAVLILLPLGFAAVFMRGLGTPPARPATASGPAAAAEPNLLLRYIGSRNVLAVLLLSVVPFSLCQMGLLLFATPVYLSNLGISQSSIGRSMMTYGFTVIYVAPYLSRFVDRSSRKGLFVAAGGVVGGLGLALVALVQGYYAILAAIFLMGVASSLAGPAQAVFALGHPLVERLGTGKAVSVQRAADKLGQMLGPIVLGGLFAATTIETGLSLVGGLYIAASALFFLVTRRQPQPA